MARKLFPCTSRNAMKLLPASFVERFLEFEPAVLEHVPGACGMHLEKRPCIREGKYVRCQHKQQILDRISLNSIGSSEPSIISDTLDFWELPLNSAREHPFKVKMPHMMK